MSMDHIWVATIFDDRDEEASEPFTKEKFFNDEAKAKEWVASEIKDEIEKLEGDEEDEEEVEDFRSHLLSLLEAKKYDELFDAWEEHAEAECANNSYGSYYLSVEQATVN